MRRMKGFAVLAIVSGMGLAACGGDQEQAPASEQAPAAQPEATTPAPTGPVPEGTTPEMIAAGKQIFEGNGICFTCHGMNAKGGPLAPDLTDDTWLWLDPAQGNMLGQIEQIVRQGVPQPKEAPAPMQPMGGAQLTDEQIRDVSAYVLSLSQ